MRWGRLDITLFIIACIACSLSHIREDECFIFLHEGLSEKVILLLISLYTFASSISNS